MKRFNLKVTIGLMAVMTIGAFNLRYAHEGYGNAVNRVAGTNGGTRTTFWGGTGGTNGGTAVEDRYNVDVKESPLDCIGSGAIYYKCIKVKDLDTGEETETKRVVAVLIAKKDGGHIGEPPSIGTYDYIETTKNAPYAVQGYSVTFKKSINGDFSYKKDDCNATCENPDPCPLERGKMGPNMI